MNYLSMSSSPISFKFSIIFFPRLKQELGFTRRITLHTTHSTMPPSSLILVSEPNSFIALHVTPTHNLMRWPCFELPGRFVTKAHHHTLSDARTAAHCAWIMSGRMMAFRCAAVLNYNHYNL